MTTLYELIIIPIFFYKTIEVVVSVYICILYTLTVKLIMFT